MLSFAWYCVNVHLIIINKYSVWQCLQAKVESLKVEGNLLFSPGGKKSEHIWWKAHVNMNRNDCEQNEVKQKKKERGKKEEKSMQITD